MGHALQGSFVTRGLEFTTSNIATKFEVYCISTGYEDTKGE